MIDFASRALAALDAFDATVPDAPVRDPAALERLGDEIARLSAHVTAATYRLLVMIRVFDEGEGWHLEGFTSCAQWLSWKTGVGPGAARERVRVARALGELPALSGALERGELSYSVARALTRVATGENEAGLVEAARHGTAAEMERLVSAWRRADRTEAELRASEQKRHHSRKLWLVCDEADGSWVLRGRLDPEAGAQLAKALEAAEEALYRAEASEASEANHADATGPEDVSAETPSAEARRADAMGLVAEAALGGGLTAVSDPNVPLTASADRFQAVVHVSAETLAGAASRADGTEPDLSQEPPHLEHGPHLHPDTARRLACDASVVTMVHDADGNALDVGRKTRTVPVALARALAHRDRDCRFPGCGCRHCDRHHVVSWAEGGETKLDNLVLLCRRHHRLVHEDGWTVEWAEAEDGEREPRFRRPDGRVLPRVPQPPPVPEDPVGALAWAHAERGLAIDHTTATPDWDGVPMDTDWALGALRGDAWPEGEDPPGGEWSSGPGG